MFLIRLRNGFGFDIEYNEDIIHRINYEDVDGNIGDALVCYNGIIAKLPFFTVYFGHFVDLDDVMKGTA